MCTYTNTPTEDQFDWLRNAGATPSWRTGPKVDHTLGTSLGEVFCVVRLLQLKCTVFSVLNASFL